MVCSCGERIDMSWHLGLCESSQHSKRPSEEVFHTRYRQEIRTDNMRIIKNHAQFSDRKNVSGQSTTTMYKSMILHYCVIFWYVLDAEHNSVSCSQLSSSVSCVVFLTTLSALFWNFHSAFLKRVEFVKFAINFGYIRILYLWSTFVPFPCEFIL